MKFDPKHEKYFIGISGGSSGSACNLPQQIGTGPYRIPRWYFNPARMRCELFYWSGCCGNGNNFNTFQSCQQVCEGWFLNCFASRITLVVCWENYSRKLPILEWFWIRKLVVCC